MGQGVVLYYKMNEFPGVAQLVARQLWELDVVRSSRTTRTRIPPLKLSDFGGGFCMIIPGRGVGCNLNVRKQVVPIAVCTVSVYDIGR